MSKRTLKVALLAVLATVLVLSFSSVALADQTWSDLPDTVTAKYGITDNQVAAISDGWGNLWKPFQNITRAQFTKMAVAAFGIDLANPATASFTDVPKSNYYYQWIEAAKAAGMVEGSAGLFRPADNITREQAIAIVARYVAKANGYNLATMYSADDITHLLAHFGDAASVGSDLRDEVAFAFDFGITEGDAYGNVAPAAKLMRIQAAAFLIRAQGLVPPAQYVPAKIELVSADKSENLIGVTAQATFKVTDAAGHPASGVLVDFDTMFANPLYVGNISAEAAVTNGNGEVTINMISAEPGTQRVSAAVSGLTAIYTTAYWLAMDEVYILDEVREAENNAGEDHTWAARVVVIGPGPRSTSQFDWYNVIDASFDPADLQTDDGVYKSIDNYNEELSMLDLDESMRTLPGIGVQWKIVNIVDDNPLTTTVDETVASVGDIVKVDGVAITAAKTALGKTDDEGVSTVTINAEIIDPSRQTKVQAIATYPENPYPQMLLDRDTMDPEDWEADDDWEQQPKAVASAIKTWIPHVIDGDSDAPITPLYAVNNTGEVETFTLTLEDVYGNPIPGYTVEWWIQGVGFFKTDGTTWVGIGEQNKDVDVTDSAGQATVDLKSLIPGQTIVHVKVMDKYGLPYKEWNVVKQWYSIDDVSLGYFDTDGDYVDAGATAIENEVNTGHTWTASVDGAKYVFTIYDLNQNGLRDDQVLIGDRADMKAAAGVYANFDGTVGASKAAGVDPAVGVPFRVTGGDTWYIRFADMDMLDNEFWIDMIGTKLVGDVRVDDGIDEVWAGLAGKTVYFFNNIGRGDTPASNTPLATIVSGEGYPVFVGSITSATSVVTDANGFAPVTINSTNKGYQYVYVVADYAENPQDGDPLKPLDWAELRWDVATKLWTPVTDGSESVEIFANGILGSANGYRWTNPILPFDGYTATVPLTIAAPPAGTAATGIQATVSAGAVTGFTGLDATGSGYTAADIGRDVTANLPAGTGAAATATIGVVGSTNNAVTQISVNAGGGGSGYTVAPTVNIGAPQIAGGTQATAVANISGGSVVSITVTNPGSGYTAAPAVTFTSNPATVTVGTIATISADNQIATITPTVATFPGASDGSYAVTAPAPLKTQATGTATVTNGVVTAVNLTNAGQGYITAPTVTVGGAGTGAVVIATVNANSTISLTLLAGGTGYGLYTNPSANPNRETLAVQVFDEYGNALEGYKVTFEIVGQGTTTDGTIDTYHPFAHFENPAFAAAGLGDLNPFVNANPIWQSATGDDDYAWGTTRNHQINFVTSLNSAAHVDLVMDETLAALQNKQHITNIVNIQVFDPDGVRIMEKEVTKVWSTAQPVLTTIQTMVSTTADGPWTIAQPATTIQPVHFRVQLFDQYGDPFTGAVPQLKLRYGNAAWSYTVIGLATPDVDGVIYGNLPLTIPGVWNFQAWNDSVTIDNLVSPTELGSNVATYTAQ